MNLVVGATGRLGGEIARALLEKGERVRVIVRDGSTFDDERAEVMRGDLKDPESLRKACAGVDAVITTANAIAPRQADDTIDSVDRLGNRNLIDAAGAEGVRRFMFISVFGASPDHMVPFMKAKGETELALRESTMSWMILRPDLFMDVWFPFIIEPALDGGTATLVGEGRQRHSMIAMKDVVAYAVAALAGTHADHRTLTLGGEPVTWRDVIDTFARVLGRDIALETVGIGEPVPHLPDFVTELLTSLEFYESVIDMSELSQTFGVKTTGLEDFVRAFVAQRA